MKVANSAIAEKGFVVSGSQTRNPERPETLATRLVKLLGLPPTKAKPPPLTITVAGGGFLSFGGRQVQG